MPTVSTSTIKTRYDEQLARLYYLVNYDPDSVLAYALIGKDLTDIGVIVATDVNTLPNLQYETPNLPDGMVYFVQSLGIIVISSNNKWITLDGTVVRIDTIISELYSWGYNAQGQLGDNTTVSKSSPVSVVGGFTDWCQISAGGAQSLAVRNNGTAWAWGCNGQGRLGDNTTTIRSSPVSVVGGFTDWCQISAGFGHSLAVRTNGTAWAWGYNLQGQLGDCTTVSKLSPVSVVGGFTDWCQVSAGRNHSLAVRTNGTAWAWGCNTYATLGDNTTVSKSSPVSVVGGFTDWCQISAAARFSLALRTNGTVWGWGQGCDGNLGDNSQLAKASPVSVVGGFTDWCQISAGSSSIVGSQGSSLAIRTNGTAWGWGQGGFGQLGDNTTTNRSSPVSVVGGFTNWCQISAGGGLGLAVRTNGTAWAWGYGRFGQLGDNTCGIGNNRSSPVSVIGGFTNWFRVSAGGSFSLGMRNFNT